MAIDSGREGRHKANFYTNSCGLYKPILPEHGLIERTGKKITIFDLYIQYTVYKVLFWLLNYGLGFLAKFLTALM